MADQLCHETLAIGFGNTRPSGPTVIVGSFSASGTLAAIEAAIPTLVQAPEIVDALHILIRRQSRRPATAGWKQRQPASWHNSREAWPKI